MFVISVICAIAAHELLSAVKINKNKRVLVYTIISAALVPMLVYVSLLTVIFAPVPQEAVNQNIFTGSFPSMILITFITSLFFIFISLLVIEAVLNIKNTKAIEKGTQLKFRHIPVALAAGMLIPYMLTSLISLKVMPYGHLFVLLPIISAFMTDSGAYFIGVAIGKHKAFPTISPNKTIEGCIGGILIGALGMMVYGIILVYASPFNVIFPALLLYGIIGAIVTEAGDLIFSFIKRKCEIKDYGRLIPGHGGMLDRFDSMIFTAPTMYLFVILLPALIP